MTPRETKILEALKAFIDKNDYSPSYSELAKITKMKSKSQAYYAISGLVEKGLVERADHRAHSIRIVEGAPKPKRKKIKHLKVTPEDLPKDLAGTSFSTVITDDPFILPD